MYDKVAYGNVVISGGDVPAWRERVVPIGRNSPEMQRTVRKCAKRRAFNVAVCDIERSVLQVHSSSVDLGKHEKSPRKVPRPELPRWSQFWKCIFGPGCVTDISVYEVSSVSSAWPPALLPNP